MSDLTTLVDKRDDLFFEGFYVYVPNRAFHTAYELEEFGILDHGGEMENRAYLEDDRLIKATLVQMAEWRAQEIPIKLYNPSDADRMFKIVNTHLSNWKIVSEYFPMATLPPFEDIEMLDKLAESLYPFANHVEEIIDLSNGEHDLAFLGNALDMRLIHTAEVHTNQYEPYAEKLFEKTLKRWERD